MKQLFDIGMGAVRAVALASLLVGATNLLQAALDHSGMLGQSSPGMTWTPVYADPGSDDDGDDDDYVHATNETAEESVDIDNDCDDVADDDDTDDDCDDAVVMKAE